MRYTIRNQQPSLDGMIYRQEATRMTTSARHRLLLTIVLLCPLGCQSAQPQPQPQPGVRPTTHSEDIPGSVVRIDGAAGGHGSGGVVGQHTVATVEHVIGKLKQPLTIQGKPVTVVRRIETGDWEQIVLLEVDWDWPQESAFAYPPQSTGPGSGYVIWNLRGAQGLTPSFALPGDSGSPILDREGRLVGHVSAVNMPGSFVQVVIGSYYPPKIMLNRIQLPAPIAKRCSD